MSRSHTPQNENANHRLLHKHTAILRTYGARRTQITDYDGALATPVGIPRSWFGSFNREGVAFFHRPSDSATHFSISLGRDNRAKPAPEVRRIREVVNGACDTQKSHMGGNRLLHQNEAAGMLQRGCEEMELSSCLKHREPGTLIHLYGVHRTVIHCAWN